MIQVFINVGDSVSSGIKVKIVDSCLIFVRSVLIYGKEQESRKNYNRAKDSPS